MKLMLSIIAGMLLLTSTMVTAESVIETDYNVVSDNTDMSAVLMKKGKKRGRRGSTYEP